jgi:hypothetical protein
MHQQISFHFWLESEEGFSRDVLAVLHNRGCGTEIVFLSMIEPLAFVCGHPKKVGRNFTQSLSCSKEMRMVSFKNRITYCHQK